MPTSTPRSRIRGRVSVWENATNPVAPNKAIMKRDFVVIPNLFSLPFYSVIARIPIRAVPILRRVVATRSRLTSTGAR